MLVVKIIYLAYIMLMCESRITILIPVKLSKFHPPYGLDSAPVVVNVGRKSLPVNLAQVILIPIFVLDMDIWSRV
jgi:hypothetical protein